MTDHGKCRRCPSPAAPGRTFCRPCLDAKTADARRRGAERVAAGLCRACGAEAAAGHAYCRPHLERIGRYDRARRSVKKLLDLEESIPFEGDE